MKRITLLLPVAFLLIAGIGGCSEEPDFPSAPAFGNLVIVNQTPNPIQVIRFRESSPTSDTWGRNMIDEAAIFDNEAYIRMPPGIYDFHFESDDVDQFWTYSGIVITAGQDTDLVIN